jgi:hypothetical protein
MFLEVKNEEKGLDIGIPWCRNAELGTGSKCWCWLYTGHKGKD